MQANSAFLNKLKSDAIEKNRKYSNKAWLLCTASVFLVAVCYNSSFLVRLPLVGLFMVFLFMLYNLDNHTLSSSKSSPIVSRNDPSMTASVNQPTTKRKNATERQSFLNAAVATDQTQNKKEVDMSAQNTMWSENFDPQSPQRITQAVYSDVPEQQPGGSGTSSLYPNAQSPFIGKSSMASLGYQITGSSNSFRSPTGSRSTVTAPSSSVNAFSRAGFQTEPSAPVWHAYHTSPPHVDMGCGSPSSHGRKGRSTLSGSYSSAEDDADDPINEIVNRVTSEQRSSDSLLRSPSFTLPSVGGFTSPRPLMRAGSGGATPAGSSRTAGLTEDRLQHVLAKYIESQEKIVSETSTEIVRQLTLRASTPNSYGSSNLLQSQDDVSRVQALLQLQSQRQVLQSRRALTLPDLLSHCRGAGISEELIRKYEAAAEVLLSPNRSNGGGHGAVSSPRNSAATPPAFQRSNSGSLTGGFGTSISTASFGKGWMSPAPVAEPFVSSSGVGGGGTIFTSSRRSRRF